MGADESQNKNLAKSRPTAMNLSSTFRQVPHPRKSDCIQKSGVLMATGIPASKTRRNSRLDKAPSSQVKLKDLYFGGLMDDSAGETCRYRRDSSIMGIL